MIYLRRKLYLFLMQYAIEKNQNMYDVLYHAILKWAKEQGFKCEHQNINREGKQIQGKSYFKCLECGEWVER